MTTKINKTCLFLLLFLPVTLIGQKESFACEAIKPALNVWSTHDAYVDDHWCDFNFNAVQYWNDFGFRKSQWDDGFGFYNVCNAYVLLNKVINAYYLMERYKDKNGSSDDWLRLVYDWASRSIRRTRSVCDAECPTGGLACADTGWPRRVWWPTKPLINKGWAYSRAARAVHEARHTNGYVHIDTNGRSTDESWSYGGAYHFGVAWKWKVTDHLPMFIRNYDNGSDVYLKCDHVAMSELRNAANQELAVRFDNSTNMRLPEYCTPPWSIEDWDALSQ